MDVAVMVIDYVLKISILMIPACEGVLVVIDCSMVLKIMLDAQKIMQDVRVLDEHLNVVKEV